MDLSARTSFQAIGDVATEIIKQRDAAHKEVLQVLGCALCHNLTIQESTLATEVSQLSEIELGRVKEIFDAARGAHLRKSMGLPDEVKT